MVALRVGEVWLHVRPRCGPDTPLLSGQLLQHLKRIISDLCKLYNLPQHPDVEMLDQPLPAEQVRNLGRGFLRRQKELPGFKGCSFPPHGGCGVFPPLPGVESSPW